LGLYFFVYLLDIRSHVVAPVVIEDRLPRAISFRRFCHLIPALSLEISIA
jgi:hypothetical protein